MDSGWGQCWENRTGICQIDSATINYWVELPATICEMLWRTILRWKDAFAGSSFLITFVDKIPSSTTSWLKANEDCVSIKEGIFKGLTVHNSNQRAACLESTALHLLTVAFLSFTRHNKSAGCKEDNWKQERILQYYIMCLSFSYEWRSTECKRDIFCPTLSSK